MKTRMLERKNQRTGAKSEALSDAPEGTHREYLEPPRKWRYHYRKLQSLREHLIGENQDRMHSIRSSGQAEGESKTDAAEEFDRLFNVSLLSVELRSLLEVEAALQRIEQGKYGICEMTGKPIAAARLRAVPWTRFSLEAESALERSRKHEGRLSSK